MNADEDMKYQDQRVDCHCNGMSAHRYTCNQEEWIDYEKLTELTGIDGCMQNGSHIH